MGKTKAQKKHGRGERRVAGFDEVAARNTDSFERRPAPTAAPAVEESSEDEGGEGEGEKSPVKRSKHRVEEEEIRAIGAAEEETGIRAGLSRKQRDELDKAEAKKRYEKLHKEGKTDEAKADLARLAEVKARREQQRLDREAADKLAEDTKASQRGGHERNEALLEALGNEGARMRGARSKENKKKKDQEKQAEVQQKRGVNDDILYTPYAGIGIEAKKPVELADTVPYSMEACKREEEDFM